MAIYPLFYCLVRFSTTKNNSLGMFKVVLLFNYQFSRMWKYFFTFLFLSKQLVYYIFFIFFCQELFYFVLFKNFIWYHSLFRRFLRCFSMITCFLFLVKNIFYFFQTFISVWIFITFYSFSTFLNDLYYYITPLFICQPFFSTFYISIHIHLFSKWKIHFI